MITLYTWPTPNGHKIQIMLEETGLAYNAVSVNIQTNEQFAPDFLKISPNNKIPAIVDSDGPDQKPYSVFESGAILVYLASKTGKFLGKTDRERFDVLQWVMFQMGGLVLCLGRLIISDSMLPRKLPTALTATPTKPRDSMGSLISV